MRPLTLPIAVPFIFLIAGSPPDWRGEGVVVEKPGNRAVVLIPDLELETEIYGRPDLALDEVVYLIATDGSNASYLLPVSFWGGVVVVGLGALWIGLAGWRRGGQRPPSGPPSNDG